MSDLHENVQMGEQPGILTDEDIDRIINAPSDPEATKRAEPYIKEFFESVRQRELKKRD